MIQLFNLEDVKMDNYDTDAQAKRFIIERKLEGWKNGVYDAKVDIKVANLTDNKKMLEAATNNLREAVKVCDMLQEELDSLKEEAADGETNA